MSKTTDPNGKRASAAATNGGKVSTRCTNSKPLILGRAGFGRISAVEGIVVSGALAADLDRLADANPDTRRTALACKYGKR